MSSRPLHDLSIAEAGKALRSGSLTSAALTDHALDRIARLDPVLHAFVEVTAERALNDAARADAAFASGLDRGPLQGIPIGLKDIYDTKGIRTTCHSRLFLDRVPEADSTVAARLAEGGAVLLGKLGTYEFAIGGPSDDLAVPPALNPWNPAHITGGSSSGSAAAVASGMMRMAMGSDTGGSIRGPAAFCGTVGLKPTYGRVPRRGVFPLSWTLDHCGPLSVSVEDAALTLQVIAGLDAADPASAAVPVPDFSAGIGQDPSGLRLGYARRFFLGDPRLGEGTVAALDAAAETLARLGADVVEVELPPYALFEACGRVILLAEAYAVHEQDLKARPHAYGRYAYQRIAPGAILSAADLVQAQRLRSELTERLNHGPLAECDALLTAGALAVAPRSDSFGPDVRPWSAIYTIPFNVTGNPVLSVPCGFGPGGLPLGLQLVGRAFDEATLLRIGAAYEAAVGLNLTPPLATSLPALAPAG